MFDFGLYTQVSDSGPHGLLLLLFTVFFLDSKKNIVNKMKKRKLYYTFVTSLCIHIPYYLQCIFILLRLRYYDNYVAHVREVCILPAKHTIALPRVWLYSLPAQTGHHEMPIKFLRTKSSE